MVEKKRWFGNVVVVSSKENLKGKLKKKSKKLFIIFLKNEKKYLIIPWNSLIFKLKKKIKFLKMLFLTKQKFASKKKFPSVSFTHTN